MSEGRDFERKVLPFLRVTWPQLVQAPPIGGWDRKGIDLLAWADAPPLPCVVQCKGFQKLEVEADHIVDGEQSIDKFARSGIGADVFLFVHNRDGRSTKFRERITARLAILVSTGQVRQAELWDRQKLLLQVYDAMAKRLAEQLRRRSEALKAAFDERIRFSPLHVAEVPVERKRVLFKRGEPCRIEQVAPSRPMMIHRTLMERSADRWTMVLGNFGMGKTTAVLSAAVESPRIALVVPCSTLPSIAVAPSTTALLEESLRSLGIIDDADPQDRDVHEDIGGAALFVLLKQVDSPYTLVLDGLDENRGYSHVEGLQRLSNQLSDLRCPIVFTTRTEHFYAMIGHFNAVFGEFSTKNSPNRPAGIYELGFWHPGQVVELVRRVLTLTDVAAEERQRLREFLTSLEDGTYRELYDELPHHPLFLQFIVDEVADRGVRRSSRPSLLKGWMERKIRRDVLSWAPGTAATRVSPEEGIDTEDLVQRIMTLMENVAWSMVEQHDGISELRESIEGSVVAEEAGRIFRGTGSLILPVLLNSLLIAQRPRRGSSLPVAFAFRVLQEYFVAAHLVRTRLSVEGFPDGVRALHDEIASAG